MKCGEDDEGRLVSQMSNVRKMWGWGWNCNWTERILKKWGPGGQSAGEKGFREKSMCGRVLRRMLSI